MGVQAVMRVKTCPVCGESFTKHPRESRAQWDGRVWCSRQCSGVRLRKEHYCVCGCGLTVNAGRYRRVWAPTHPLAGRDGNVLEHRKIAYDAGLVVPDGYHVHHKNGDKADNRLENLEVIPAAEHTRRHLQEQGFVVNQYGRWPLLAEAAS